MQLLNTILDLVFPRSCPGCSGPLGTESGHICWDCRAGFDAVVFPFCSRCGDPVFGAVDRGYVCSHCARRMPHYDAARSAVRYSGALTRIMQDFKYNLATHLSRDLAILLKACVDFHYGRAHFDCVTCVPLYPRKERERTYNQSQLLARELAHMIRKPLWTGCLTRTRSTSTQTHLSAFERARNVRGAFAIREPQWVLGRSFVLVDDVMTTGATINECARTLKQAGAAGVYAVTVARG